MYLKHYLILIVSILLISCSGEPAKIELSNPGFGVVETSIEARSEGVDLPVLLKTDEAIKGIQFTLAWEPSIGIVGTPVLTGNNSGFTITAKTRTNGTMKVLIFSMTGEELNTKDPEIMRIPVSILDPESSLFTLEFEKVIFAGPNARSYDIPVTDARLKISHP